MTVVYEGLCTFEFGIVAELFGMARPELGVDWYDFSVVTPDRGPLSATGGISVQASEDLSVLTFADTVVIPGWRDPTETPPDRLLNAIKAAHTHGARLVSICSGVFVLAATGLLDGRPATTHWRYVDQLSQRYPAVEVEPDVLYIDDGDILTSAGSAAGIDLCLHIIRSDHGAEVGSQVARRLVVQPHREGGQAQYIPQPIRPSPQASSIAEVMDWAIVNVHRPLTVADLADEAMMASRTFARRFKEEVGVTPHAWLTRQRLHRAQQLLETTDQPVERVARQAGFESAETLRHHFRNTLHTTPTNYRKTFIQRGSS